MRSGLIGIATVMLLQEACGSSSTSTTASIKEVQAQVETKLPDLARELQSGVPTTEMIYARLETYLSVNSDFYGSTFAVSPEQTNNAGGLAPYVYRDANGTLLRKDLAGVPQYDYTTQEWYAAPKAAGRASWSAPYFDAGGGEINMITYSLPVYQGGAGGAFLGILTTDVGIDGRAAE